MYKAIGRLTGKVYATGSKAECNRKLIEKFPSFGERHENGTKNQINQVLPEQIIIRRVSHVEQYISCK